jgi:pSer/pThr/pTyr-binding forkhead associated (FHA) protein
VPTLEILSGAHAGATYTFSEEAKVGKDETCLVKIGDPGVSRFHARIAKEAGSIQIEDMGSSNGTYVNFKKRGQGEKTPLSDKDIIFFGRTVTKFWVDAPPDKPAGVSLDFLRETFPIKGFACPHCDKNLEPDLRARVREQEQVEVIRRLRLHQLDAASLERLLQQAR